MKPEIQILERAYEGVLAEAIPSSIGGWFGLNPPEETERLQQEHRQRKLPALFAHFGIDSKEPDAWQRLACLLARRHVPGFQGAQELRGIGVEPFWNPALGLLVASGASPWVPKRGRGRPAKVPAYRGGGLFGLFVGAGDPPDKRPKGRPEKLTRDQKRRWVARFDQEKTRHGTDKSTAMAFVQEVFPEFNLSKKRTETWRLVRRIRSYRHELKKFDKA